jgi:hypothetical protein
MWQRTVRCAVDRCRAALGWGGRMRPPLRERFRPYAFRFAICGLGDYSGTHSKGGKNATIETAGRDSIIYVTLRWNYGAISPGMRGSMLRN